MGAVPSHVVLDGPVERIREEVKERINLLGREGGYVCTPDQGLPYPPEHLETLHAAVEAYGRYPLEEC